MNTLNEDLVAKSHNIGHAYRTLKIETENIKINRSFKKIISWGMCSINIGVRFRMCCNKYKNIKINLYSYTILKVNRPFSEVSHNKLSCEGILSQRNHFKNPL